MCFLFLFLFVYYVCLKFGISCMVYLDDMILAFRFEFG